MLGGDLAEDLTFQADDRQARRGHRELERAEQHDLGIGQLQDDGEQRGHEADWAPPADLDHRTDHEAAGAWWEDRPEGGQDLGVRDGCVGREHQLIDRMIVDASQ